jgi:hypothetical protein
MHAVPREEKAWPRQSLDHPKTGWLAPISVYRSQTPTDQTLRCQSPQRKDIFHPKALSKRKVVSRFLPLVLCPPPSIWTDRLHTSPSHTLRRPIQTHTQKNGKRTAKDHSRSHPRRKNDPASGHSMAITHDKTQRTRATGLFATGFFVQSTCACHTKNPPGFGYRVRPKTR